MICKLVINIL